MARTIEKLSATSLKSKHPGMHADGSGLYFQVKNGGRSWVLRYMLAGKARYMGLGPFPDVSLADARREAEASRKMIREGIDPIEARRQHNRKAQRYAAAAVTFEESATRYIDAKADGWRNPKHIAQWRNTLQNYAYPVFGSLPVQDIDTGLVTKALEPIWTAKPETAGRVRGRIEAVLDWAKVRGYRDGENPARWRGHLDKVLPSKSKVHKVKHHPSLPYSALPSFLQDLRTREGVAAAALYFLILTAARTGEVIGMRGEEIDFQNALWIVPAERMKAGREHIVPLSPAAIELLRRMNPSKNAYVFPGLKPPAPLSNMAMLKTIERMNLDNEREGQPRYVDPMLNGANITAHGFRATFKTWASEQTAFPKEVIEAALAHVNGDKVEAA